MSNLHEVTLLTNGRVGSPTDVPLDPTRTPQPVADAFVPDKETFPKLQKLGVSGFSEFPYFSYYFFFFYICHFLSYRRVIICACSLVTFIINILRTGALSRSSLCLPQNPAQFLMICAAFINSFGMHEQIHEILLGTIGIYSSLVTIIIATLTECSPSTGLYAKYFTKQISSTALSLMR